MPVQSVSLWSGHPRRQTLVPSSGTNSKHKHTACRVSVSLSVAVQLNSSVAPPPVQAWTASTCPPCCYRRQDYYTAAALLLQHFWRSTPAAAAAAAAVAARLRDLCSEAVLLLQLKQHKLYVHIRKLALYSKACLCASACVLASSLLGLCACASLCAAHWSFSKKNWVLISDAAVHVKEWFVWYTPMVFQGSLWLLTYCLQLTVLNV